MLKLLRDSEYSDWLITDSDFSSLVLVEARLLRLSRAAEREPLACDRLSSASEAALAD